MRTKLICIGIFFYFLLVACSENQPMPDPPDLNSADKVETRIIVEGKPHTFVVGTPGTQGTQEVIGWFEKVFSVKPARTDCDSIGSITFYAKDSVLFHGGFNCEKNGCEYILKGNNGWKLNLEAAMHLRSIYDTSRLKNF